MAVDGRGAPLNFVFPLAAIEIQDNLLLRLLHLFFDQIYSVTPRHADYFDTTNRKLTIQAEWQAKLHPVVGAITSANSSGSEIQCLLGALYSCIA